MKSGIGIRITSDPDVTRIEQPRTERARAAVELPLRLLLVSDLTPSDPVADWSGPSRVASVDSNNFDVLMQQLAPRMSLEVPNRISDSPALLDVDLTFNNLRDFGPEHVVQQVPALAHLFEIRTLVSRVKRGEIGLDDFRERIQEIGVDEDWADQIYQALSATKSRETPASRPPSSEAPRGGEAMDRLLDLVDFGEDEKDVRPAPNETSGSGGFMNALIHAATGGSKPDLGVEKPVAELLITDLDEVISSQLNAILDHPAFRRLEAAWRGLKLLVDRINVRANVQFDVLAAGKGALSEALYHQVLLPEHSEDLERPPLSALILDFSFDNGQADIELLEDLAETGSSLQVPVIASADPSFFGVAEPSGLTRLPSLRRHLEGPEYIAWNKLRQKDEAKHLALAVPPFLLRYSYGREHPVSAFEFEEEGHLWGGGALAVAVVMAAGFERTGWPTHVRGNGDNRIGNLPVWKTAAGHSPLAALLPERKQSDLADAGFVVLGSRANHDAVYVAHAPTIRDSGAYETAEAADEVRAHNSLPCQLFVARIAQFMLTFQSDIAPGTEIGDIESDLSRRLNTLLSAPGVPAPEGAVSIDHLSDTGLPDHEIFTIRLQPPRSILDESVSLVMHLQVRK